MTETRLFNCGCAFDTEPADCKHFDWPVSDEHEPAQVFNVPIIPDGRPWAETA